jgi:hypothetical protein
MIIRFRFSIFENAIQRWAREHFNDIKYVDEVGGVPQLLSKALPDISEDEAKRLALMPNVKDKVNNIKIIH